MSVKRMIEAVLHGEDPEKVAEGLDDLPIHIVGTLHGTPPGALDAQGNSFYDLAKAKVREALRLSGFDNLEDEGDHPGSTFAIKLYGQSGKGIYKSIFNALSDRFTDVVTKPHAKEVSVYITADDVGFEG